jgi:hypothetical protein
MTSPATPLEAHDGEINEAIADLALAEREAETNQLRTLLTLVDGTLREVGNTNICSSAVMTDHLLDMRNLLSDVLDGRTA